MSLARPLNPKDLLPTPDEVTQAMKTMQLPDLKTARARVIQQKALDALKTNLTIGDLRMLLSVILKELM